MAGGAKGDVGDMAGRRAGNSLTGFKQMRGEALKSLGARAATGVGVLGAGGAGYAATKEASALETIANQKVMQYLQSRGYDTSALNGQAQEQPQVQEPQMDPAAVKMANDMRMAVEQHTDQLALQMLQQMGIQVDQGQEVEQQVDPSYQAQGQVQNFQPGFQG
jgi:D-arabinose 1-dehydrogenase-like Zn-dependent alcohol dehydrogenase